MRWHLSNRADPRALPLADRHYSRQRPGTPQFVRNGSSLVLLTAEASALWVSVWQAYTRHRWPGVWECSLFRNESPHLSSELIREAMAATLFMWGRPPALGFLTTIDASKVRPKRDPGRCFLRAGYLRAGHTGSGKLVLLCPVASLPAPAQPFGADTLLLEEARRDRSHQQRSRNVSATAPGAAPLPANPASTPPRTDPPPQSDAPAGQRSRSAAE